MNSGEAVLALARRFGLVTTGTIVAVLGLSPRAARRHCRDLVTLGRLHRNAFMDGRCYWADGPALGVQSLASAYGVMFRCCQCGGEPWEPTGRVGPAVICRRGEEAEAVFVDFGGGAAHVADKLRRFSEGPAPAGLTALGVVVAVEDKAHAVHKAARRRDLTLPVRFAVCPDLGGLLIHAPR